MMVRKDPLGLLCKFFEGRTEILIPEEVEKCPTNKRQKNKRVTLQVLRKMKDFRCPKNRIQRTWQKIGAVVYWSIFESFKNFHFFDAWGINNFSTR